MPIPVYVFTGFLDAGKTKFIQETLYDKRFNSGERTLLLVCEEGEEEYEPFPNVHMQVIENQDEVTPQQLAALTMKYRAERVIVELNGMKSSSSFFEKMPQSWELAQVVAFADGRSILSYNDNMRALVVDKLSVSEMVIFNRLPKTADTIQLHKLARALNRRIAIIYEYADGSTVFDEIEDPLPFDISAPVIDIQDDDYALFYRDISEEPKKYSGKTVRFKAQVAQLKKEREGYFAPGRFVMTCCADDIAFMGMPCKYENSASLRTKQWVSVTATVAVRFHAVYRGVGPILTALSVEQATAATNEVATF
ncbi:MAG: outer membrane insertion C- signal [Oscillospiraceae bacterium]|jgi:hypothetical protein|nr:outer membrane insertion C- signal [Oscillospiraceae bacterium]